MPRKTVAEVSDRLDELEKKFLGLLEELPQRVYSVAVAHFPSLIHQASGGQMPPFPRLSREETSALLREEARMRKERLEASVEPWKHLVRREHPWRKQLYIKGRNLTARQLVGAIDANNLDEAKAAANYELPVEAIREARTYVASNKDLLETETEIERLMLKRGGVGGGPRAVSR